MKTLIVDFAKRDEKNKLYLTPEQCAMVKTKDKVRLTDNDIATIGVVVRDHGKSYIRIDWEQTEFRLKESQKK